MNNSYMSGTLVRTLASFTTAGVPTDPDTVTLKYKPAGGDVTTLTYADSQVTKDTTGNYHVDLDTSGFTGPDSQLWTLEWLGTGACQAINVDFFEVTPPAL